VLSYKRVHRCVACDRNGCSPTHLGWIAARLVKSVVPRATARKCSMTRRRRRLVACWASSCRPQPGKWIIHPPGAVPERSPAWRPSARRPSGLPRARRRPHYMDLPTMRRDGVRAADRRALHHAQRARSCTGVISRLRFASRWPNEVYPDA
jgi:hypothetical protein